MTGSPTSPRRRGPSVREIRETASSISARSPLWVEGDEEEDDGPTELNLDCGSKMSVARAVATSPQRYSGAFGSRVPRFCDSAYYRDNRPAGLSAKDGHQHDGHRQRFYDADAQQPHIGVKDPTRQHTVFRSDVERFPSDVPAFEARGLHPQMKKAQPSFATQDSKHLTADQMHWNRNGFFHPRGPRLPVAPKSLTADLQAPDLHEAGQHVDQMHLAMAQTVDLSPRKLRVMTSKSDRFTSPRTYVHNEPRSVLAIKAPYDHELGPGSYDATSPGAMVVDRPEKPQCNFASGSPRLPRERPPLNVGSNTSSVGVDQKSWQSPRVWTSKAHFGRHQKGPQVGSYEGAEGLGRSTSPDRRSPDVTYSLDHSTQKRPLSEQVSHSKQRYSASFRSHSPRLQMSRDEIRSISYPTDATDQFDLSAAASGSPHGHSLNLSQLSLEAPRDFGNTGGTSASSPRGSPVFVSESVRFPSQPAPLGSVVDLVGADRKRWHESGQAITTRSPRFVPVEANSVRPRVGDWEANSADPSPGPGTYINPRTWGASRASASPMSLPHSPISPQPSSLAEGRQSARRRLDVSAM